MQALDYKIKEKKSRLELRSPSVSHYKLTETIEKHILFFVGFFSLLSHSGRKEDTSTSFALFVNCMVSNRCHE